MEFQLNNSREKVKSKKQESMVADDSFQAKWSDKRMEGDESLRTVECLRGRLLAERAASKAANQESELISKKVTELEKQLKMEIKSRNKAEKRLKFLMKKLDALNILYVSADESSERSEISSVSSSKSHHQMELQKTQFNNISKCVTDTDSKRHNCPSREGNLESLDEANSENSNEHVSQKDGAEDNDLKKEDDNGSNNSTTKNKNDNEEHNQDTYHNVDNSMALVIVEKNVTMTPRNDEDHHEDIFDTSMALVVVDSMAKEEKQEVSISNGNVKDVLDALKHARESLQTSMDMRRHVESNIPQARLDSIPC